MDTLEGWLTVGQSATRKQVTREAIGGAIRRGELTPVAVGRERLLRVEQIDAWTPRNYRARRSEPSALSEEVAPKRPRGRPPLPKTL